VTVPGVEFPRVPSLPNLLSTTWRCRFAAEVTVNPEEAPTRNHPDRGPFSVSKKTEAAIHPVPSEQLDMRRCCLKTKARNNGQELLAYLSPPGQGSGWPSTSSGLADP
jgi:hypothetical protein